MKRLLLLTLSFLVVGMIYAQKPPKGNPVKADSYLAKNELEKAKAEIDKAVTLEKHSGKQGVWITRAKIYQAIAQYAEARWPTTATYKRKGTVRANVMRVSKRPDYAYFRPKKVAAYLHSYIGVFGN